MSANLLLSIEARRAAAALESVCNGLESLQRSKPGLEIEQALEDVRSSIDWLDEYIETLKEKS